MFVVFVFLLILVSFFFQKKKNIFGGFSLFQSEKYFETVGKYLFKFLMIKLKLYSLLCRFLWCWVWALLFLYFYLLFFSIMKRKIENSWINNENFYPKIIQNEIKKMRRSENMQSVFCTWWLNVNWIGNKREKEKILCK